MQSGLFTPTVPAVRRRFSPSLGIRRSGFWFSDGGSRRTVCSSSTQGAEKLSPSESRAPRLVSKGCKLVGCGSAVPSVQISNDDLSKMVDTSDEWISVRTGIRNRRILSKAQKESSPAWQKLIQMTLSCNCLCMFNSQKIYLACAPQEGRRFNLLSTLHSDGERSKAPKAGIKENETDWTAGQRMVRLSTLPKAVPSELESALERQSNGISIDLVASSSGKSRNYRAVANSSVTSHPNVSYPLAIRYKRCLHYWRWTKLYEVGGPSWSYFAYCWFWSTASHGALHPLDGDDWMGRRYAYAILF
ncbi:3-oxoacyl-[acyl-carrier-protein] synthase 3 A, chloroplastic [Sesamum alatum]|uniref:3-oxoacyl-[acyl-carrier-protein] synthase 3 A, chloroplastic n=1 Tax=Sesamum alatum TaxID=300844 RepID=A0AAE2CRK9_9LAMI|nr:3-oxoacyl-[acyl-carrier-protein] synthase 3 A, chloroplastic [Sesamum alatum]